MTISKLFEHPKYIAFIMQFLFLFNYIEKNINIGFYHINCSLIYSYGLYALFQCLRTFRSALHSNHIQIVTRFICGLRLYVVGSVIVRLSPIFSRRELKSERFRSAGRSGVNTPNGQLRVDHFGYYHHSSKQFKTRTKDRRV